MLRGEGHPLAGKRSHGAKSGIRPFLFHLLHVPNS